MCPANIICDPDGCVHSILCFQDEIGRKGKGVLPCMPILSVMQAAYHLKRMSSLATCGPAHHRIL